MKYKTVSGTIKRVKLSHDVITSFISAPSLFSKFWCIADDAKRKSVSLGVADPQKYLANALHRGECVIVKNQEYCSDKDEIHSSISDEDKTPFRLPPCIVVCTKCTFVLSFSKFAIVDVWKGGL